jgi:hypothetical protein
MKPKTRGISEATIDGNGIVRSNSVSTTETNLILARNFFPFRKPGNNDSCKSGLTGIPTIDSFTSSFCMGAMVGVGFSAGSSTSQFMNFVGAGLALGSPLSESSKFSWNVGIGMGRKFGHKTLAPKIELDAALPSGVTEVSYRTSDVSAPFIYFSTKW